LVADTFYSWVLKHPLKWFYCWNGKCNHNRWWIKAVELDLEKKIFAIWAESMGEDVP
jgi:predicted oxidoreductase